MRVSTFGAPKKRPQIEYNFQTWKNCVNDIRTHIFFPYFGPRNLAPEVWSKVIETLCIIMK